MIPVNQQFNSQLGAPQKRALYALEIPAFGIVITSFTESENLLATSSTNTNSNGWGQFLYGLWGWGS